MSIYLGGGTGGTIVENALILHRHQSKVKHHFIIQIVPALEQWILNIYKEEGIAFENLPSGLKEFKKYTKKQSSIYNNDLKNLYIKMSLKQIIQKLKSSPVG